MFIEIEDLNDDPLHVQHLYGEGDLPFRHEDAFLREPVQLAFVLSHEEGALRLVGRLTTSVMLLCSRCLKEVAEEISTGFDLFYLPQPQSSSKDEEIELKYEDMAVGYYDGVRLDVDLVALEQIELALPMKFVCRPECRGLCFRCGADMNLGSCSCKSEEIDSRFAVLEQFRKKMNT